LNRSKLPKKYKPSGCMVGGSGPKSEEDPNQFYTHSDLRIGSYLNIYGRQVLLTKADKFTEEFYINIHKLKHSDFEVIKQELQKDKYSNIKKEIPPYNGYGTQEDSLGSWHSLIPKPPRKDHIKLNKFDSCVLRFLAKLTPSKTSIENYQRRFVFEFYLQDDTLLIYERQIRNSGFLGGKFLERSKYSKNKNKQQQQQLTTSDENIYFHGEDFYVGAQLNINGFDFDLLETDSATNSIVNNNTEVFTRDTPEQILQGLADKLYDKSVNQTQTFLNVDSNKDRMISPEELNDLCMKYNWKLNPHQLKAVFRYFDVDDSGSIDANEFFSALQKYKLQKHIYSNKEIKKPNNKLPNHT
jgi:hypothetical protein